MDIPGYWYLLSCDKISNIIIIILINKQIILLFWFITRRVVFMDRRFGTPVGSILWVDENTGMMRG